MSHLFTVSVWFPGATYPELMQFMQLPRQGETIRLRENQRMDKPHGRFLVLSIEHWPSVGHHQYAAIEVRLARAMTA